MAGGVRKPDRIIGGNFVEIGSIDVAEFREFAFVPARALDPDIGRRVRDFLAHEFDGLGNTLDVAEVEVVDGGGFVEVAMRVNQAGSSGASVEIDDAGVFSGVLADFVIGADSDNFAVLNGEGLRDGILGIYGDDFSVDQKEIGVALQICAGSLLSAKRRNGGRRDGEQQEASKQEVERRPLKTGHAVSLRWIEER